MKKGHLIGVDEKTWHVIERVREYLEKEKQGTERTRVGYVDVIRKAILEYVEKYEVYVEDIAVKYDSPSTGPNVVKMTCRCGTVVSFTPGVGVPRCPKCVRIRL